MIYQLKRFLWQPYVFWQRRKHSHIGDIGKKILEVNLYSRAIKLWFRDNAKTKLLLEHDLNADSIVYDVGGFIGDWTDGIVARYNPRVEVFEAVPGFIRRLGIKFADNDKVSVHPYGLLDKNCTEQFLIKGPGSTSARDSSRGDHRMVEAELRDFRDVFDELGHSEVDLLKINIEGGEFPLLNRLLELGLAPHFKTIMVQYHEWAPNAYWQRIRTNRRLARTHRCVWSYTFVWEKWERIEGA